MKLGIISDIHEDVNSLTQALHLLDQLGCHEVACLGDISGFTIPSFGYFETRNASECLKLVRDTCKYIVLGNHDLFPAKKIPKYKAGFEYPEDWYGMDHSVKRDIAKEKVWLNEEVEMDTLYSAGDKEFIMTLPEFLVIRVGGEHVLLSHYLYPDLSGSTIPYYENFGPVEGHFEFMKKNNCRLAFSGHQHAEGFYLATSSGTEHHDYGRYQLERELQWIIGPCIANGKKKNGCMIFNTDTFQLSVIPLNSPPRMMQTILLNKE